MLSGVCICIMSVLFCILLCISGLCCCWFVVVIICSLYGRSVLIACFVWFICFDQCIRRVVIFVFSLDFVFLLCFVIVRIVVEAMFDSCCLCSAFIVFTCMFVSSNYVCLLALLFV